MKNSTEILPTNKTDQGKTANQVRYALCMLAVVLILSTTTLAQQANRNVSGSSNYSVVKQNGKLVLSDGRSKTVISNDPNANSPLVNGKDVFYIGNTKSAPNTSGSSIFVYNVNTKTTEDIISRNAAASEYNLKNVVENILLDNVHGKLFFSTSLKNRHGYAEFLTWIYDLGSKKMAVYRDGRIESIDEQGNQLMIFKGYDSKGQYTSRLLVGTDGNTIKELGREYASKPLNNTK